MLEISGDKPRNMTTIAHTQTHSRQTNMVHEKILCLATQNASSFI